jgi:hypothetical protein
MSSKVTAIVITVFTLIGSALAGAPAFNNVANGPPADTNDCPTCQDVYSLYAYAANCYCAYPLGSTRNAIRAVPTNISETLDGCCIDSFIFDSANQEWESFELIEGPE